MVHDLHLDYNITPGRAEIFTLRTKIDGNKPYSFFSTYTSNTTYDLLEKDLIENLFVDNREQG